MTEYPTTPPPELVEQWMNLPVSVEESLEIAARWGADQELEACCEWLADDYTPVLGQHLRAARRPKPPSLKEQALKALETEDDSMPLRSLARAERFALIRRALEALPND